MAFPTVVSTAESSVNTAGTSHTVTLPGSIVASDLVLITMDIGSTSATLNALANWTELLDEASANGLKIVYYTGSGVPSDPTFTSSASTRSASIAWRISGVNKSVAPQIGTTATGTSATPDPPASAAPPSTKDYLFIAFAGMAGEEADDDTWGNTPPTNYTPNPPLQKSCGTAGVNLGGLILAASRQLNTGSAEDPGSFGVDVSAAWRAQTVTVHPIINTTSTPTTATLALTTFAPTISITNNVRVTPSTATLVTARFAPTVTASDHKTVVPATVSLTLAEFAPTVLTPRLATPVTAALTLATFVPIVTASVNITVVPALASLTLSTFAPTVSTPQLVTPLVAALALSTFAPTISTPQLTTPSTVTLSLATFAPTVQLGITIVPSVTALATATFAPTIIIEPAGGDVTVAPATANLALTTYAPTVTVHSNEAPAVTLAISATTIAWDGVTIGKAEQPALGIAWSGIASGKSEVSMR